MTIKLTKTIKAFEFIPSCWMRARMTCWERRQGGVNICEGLAISHVLTTSGRLLTAHLLANNKVIN